MEGKQNNGDSWTGVNGTGIIGAKDNGLIGKGINEKASYNVA